MILSLLLIIAAFIVLVQGAKYFVAGAGSIARRLGISAFVVGLTVVSIGTSAPELFVNVIAAQQGSTDLSIGNILGSNIADLLLGIGIAAIIIPLKIKESTVWKEMPFALLAAIMIFVFGADQMIAGVLPNEIGRIEGIALLGFFAIFLVYTFGLSRVVGSDDQKIEKYNWPKSIALTIGGLAALAIGGKFAVDAAVALASGLGISENLIGLTVVATGTSLPEIVTAIVAARARHIDLVVGGLVGTVIFNAFFALGVTAVVHPLPFAADSITDALVWLGVVLLLFAFMFVGKRHIMEKWQGHLFIVLYIVYMIFAIIRG